MGRSIVLCLLALCFVEAAIWLRVFYQATSVLPGTGIDGFVYDAAGWLIAPFRGQDTLHPAKSTGYLDLPALVAADVYLFAGLATIVFLYASRLMAGRLWPRGFVLRLDVTPCVHALGWLASTAGSAARTAARPLAKGAAFAACQARRAGVWRALECLAGCWRAGKARLQTRWQAAHAACEAAAQRLWSYVHATYTLLDARTVELVRSLRQRLADIGHRVNGWSKRGSSALARRVRALAISYSLRYRRLTAKCIALIARLLREDRERLERLRALILGRKDPAADRAQALRSLVESSLRNLGGTAVIREHLEQRLPSASNAAVHAHVSRRDLLRLVFSRSHRQG